MNTNLEGRLVLWRIIALVLAVFWLMALGRPAEAGEVPFYVGFDTRITLERDAAGDVWIRNVAVEAATPAPRACANPVTLASAIGEEPPAPDQQVLCCCHTIGGGQCCAFTSSCYGNFVPGCFCSP